MSPAAIIEATALDGVTLAVSAPGRLKATGEQVAVARWLPTLREHKAELIIALQSGAERKADVSRVIPVEIRQLIGTVVLLLDCPASDREDFARDWLGDPEAIEASLRKLVEYYRPQPVSFPDERRTCRQCANLRSQVCGIAQPDSIVSARRGYEPWLVLLRCPGYAPLSNESDQRCGTQRWPGLSRESVESDGP